MRLPLPVQPASEGPSLSQFLHSGVAPRGPESSLSSLLRGGPAPPTADFLGRTLGLSASQQLLLGFQPQRSVNHDPQPEARNTLQLHFPPSSEWGRRPAMHTHRVPTVCAPPPQQPSAVECRCFACCVHAK